jgi:hypothetical protein
MHSIDPILKLLINFKRADLAKLLKGAHYELRESGSYGSQLYSILTTAEIYVPFVAYEPLKQLCWDDHSDIIRALCVIHPVKPSEVEINSVEFFVWNYWCRATLHFYFNLLLGICNATF